MEKLKKGRGSLGSHHIPLAVVGKNQRRDHVVVSKAFNPGSPKTKLYPVGSGNPWETSHFVWLDFQGKKKKPRTQITSIFEGQYPKKQGRNSNQNKGHQRVPGI